MAVHFLFNYSEDFDFDIDLNKVLNEILDKNTKIKLDSEYVNDYLGKDEATEDNIKNFKNVAVFKELEDDMESFCNDIAKEISKIPDVEDVKIKKSKSLGMSTYIIVTFEKPSPNDKSLKPYIDKDSKFINHYLSGFGNGGYGGEYRLKFRLSNHDVVKATDADVEINVTNKIYNEFKDEVVKMCKKRIQQLDNYFDDFKRTGKISPKQIARNKERNERRNAYNKIYHEIINVLINKLPLTESFGGERLQAVIETEAENILDYLNICNVKLEDIVSAVESKFRDCKVSYVQLIRATAECLVENILDYTFEDSFDYNLLFDDIRKELNITDINENLVTDLKSKDISITPKVIKNISFDVDIQNANIQKLDIIKPNDVKNKYVLVSANATNEVIAIYNKSKFDYNPEKLKISELTDGELYSCWEVINISSVLQKQRDRLALKQDYVDLQKGNTTYNKPPKSTRYVFDKDWNPEVNKEYYTKLLQQNKLGEYSNYLEHVYDVMENLIEHRRKEQTTGKKLVYSNYIKKLASQIEVTETEMDALDKNMGVDVNKLKKSLTKLTNSANLAEKFIETEDKAIKTWGYPEKRKSAKLER